MEIIQRLHEAAAGVVIVGVFVKSSGIKLTAAEASARELGIVAIVVDAEEGGCGSLRFRCVESRRGEDFEASKPKDYRNSPLWFRLQRSELFSLGFLIPRVALRQWAVKNAW